MYRGEVWWATLPPPVGSGPGGRRPVVVVQADHVTQSRIGTVIVIIVTSNLNLARYRGNVLLPALASGLPLDSVANVSQVVTVDKSLLTEFVAALPATLMRQIDAGIKLICDLP